MTSPGQGMARKRLGRLLLLVCVLELAPLGFLLATAPELPPSIDATTSWQAQRARAKEIYQKYFVEFPPARRGHFDAYHFNEAEEACKKLMETDADGAERALRSYNMDVRWPRMNFPGTYLLPIAVLVLCAICALFVAIGRFAFAASLICTMAAVTPLPDLGLTGELGLSFFYFPFLWTVPPLILGFVISVIGFFERLNKMPRMQYLPLDELKAYAKMNDPEAQYRLGLRYDKGLEVDLDIAEGHRLVRASAEQGYPEALYFLGVVYGMGRGVPEDYVEVYKFMELAAQKGVADAPRLRDVATKFLDEEQIERAKYLARDWQEKYG